MIKKEELKNILKERERQFSLAKTELINVKRELYDTQNKLEECEYLISKYNERKHNMTNLITDLIRDSVNQIIDESKEEITNHILNIINDD